MLSLKVVFMMQGRRVKLSANQRMDMWGRWKAGQSLHEIGRAFSKSHVVIHFLLARHGGIAPAARRRSLRTLTLAEREDISRGIACGSSIREIAKGLERAVSGFEDAKRGRGGPVDEACIGSVRELNRNFWEKRIPLSQRHKSKRTLTVLANCMEEGPEKGRNSILQAV